jgi:GNAT superfamily N-acetyltransferase
MVLYAEKNACQAGGWFMETRQAVPNDSLLLSSLCMDVQRLHAQYHPGMFKMPENEDFAVSFFDEMLADPDIRIFIAEEDQEKAVGYMVCKLIERPETPLIFAARYLLIDQISIRPSVQRHGAGAVLLQQAEKLARDLNVQRIQLDSYSFNLKAHLFFEKMGFVKLSHRFWMAR